ncbi:hypothetical protein IEQ34_004082 [Dendrobium chrysotoxum]|uniref:Uncharacterized protein n=1 Tax=Dendrobium chrysotoxum TaxID=161865 RepID=A0AAV7GZ85_DENCH|nr:hypothetical protein IEQ34_004082 [Dendrobium chrysotoxum]
MAIRLRISWRIGKALTNDWRPTTGLLLFAAAVRILEVLCIACSKMGANCCVAARDKPLPNRNGHEASAYRNIRYSPSWSIRWDNRTHIEDIVENMVYCSHHNSGNATSEVKSAADTETDGLSDGESPPKVFPSSQWRKSYVVGGSDKSKFIAAGKLFVLMMNYMHHLAYSFFRISMIRMLRKKIFRHFVYCKFINTIPYKN